MSLNYLYIMVIEGSTTRRFHHFKPSHLVWSPQDVILAVLWSQDARTVAMQSPPTYRGCCSCAQQGVEDRAPPRLPLLPAPSGLTAYHGPKSLPSWVLGLFNRGAGLDDSANFILTSLESEIEFLSPYKNSTRHT